MMGRLEYLITFASDQSLTVVEGANNYPVTVPAGSYYLSQPGDQALGLLETLEAALEAATPFGWSVTMPGAASSDTRVWINPDLSVTIQWEDTDLRDVLGFDQDEAGSLIIGDLGARGVWAADVPFRSLNGGGSWRGTVESDLSQTVTSYGQVYSLVSATLRRNRIEWRGLARAGVWESDEGLLRPSLEAFWREGILGLAAWGTAGGPVLWFPDEDDLDTFHEYTPVNVGAFAPTQLREGFTGYWIFALALIEVP